VPRPASVTLYEFCVKSFGPQLSTVALEDYETRAYILLDVRTPIAFDHPAVSAVRSACVRTVAGETGEMPALSHIGSRNPRDAT